MKRSILSLALITLLGGAALLAGVSLLTAQQDGGLSDDLMETKTRHAQNILRGLALGDLTFVSNEAQALEDVTVDAGFDSKPVRHADYGREFLKSVRELKKEAGNRNFAGSYYQFSRMTGLCFTCHEHIREHKD
jgi:hypothetical protein